MSISTLRQPEPPPLHHAGVGAPGVDGSENPPYFAGYPGEMSYVARDTIRVHVATRSTEDCFVDIYRVIGREPGTFTPRLRHVFRAGPIAPVRYPKRKDRVPLAPGDSDENGCNWPGVDLLTVPDDWASGVYILQFNAADSPAGKVSRRLGQDSYFILRPAKPGATSKILFQVGVATWSAYHVWRNRSTYVGFDKKGIASYDLRAGKVSFHRPGVGLGSLNEIAWWPGKGRQYLLPFLEWIETSGVDFEYCTGLDIGSGAIRLEDYRLVVTIGHDEYWTSTQRDAFDRYIAGGGNAAFFGGNLAYWQIRPSADGSSFECHKRTDQFSGEPLDPFFRSAENAAGERDREVTAQFDGYPVDRPTTQLMGVSWHNSGDPAGFDGAPVAFRWAGSTWWWEQSGGPERPPLGFTVTRPDHWAFAGTGLKAGDVFGAEQKLVGYECDGLNVVWENGMPLPAPDSGTPAGLEIIALADCSTWAEMDYSRSPPVRRPECQINDGASNGMPTMVSWGSAGGGEVFTAPTTDWTHALVPTPDYTHYKSLVPHVNPASEIVQRITLNVLRKLGGAAG